MTSDGAESEGVIPDLLRRWAEAEVAADVHALDSMSTEDFHLVGPAGFVLDKHAWLERYRTRALRTSALSLKEVDVRRYGPTAVSIAVQRLSAEYEHHPAGGTFRTTHLFTILDGQWRLAGQHLSPIIRPPLSGPSSPVSSTARIGDQR